MNLRQAAQQALDWLEDDAATTVDEAYTKERQIADALRAALAEPDSDYERGFVDGMNLQTKGSVDKAVNRMAQTTHWEGCEAVHPECKEKNT